VVLVDHASAGASEVVTAAIQDHGRGIVFGERTLGHGSIQVLFTPRKFGSEYFIKLTVGYYDTPCGRPLHRVGVAPDIEIPRRSGELDAESRSEERVARGSVRTRCGPPDSKLTAAVRECGARQGLADLIQAANPRLDLHFDYALAKAADFLECALEMRAWSEPDVIR
jgi:hypothetical protein